jgi:hypothetical protein
MARLAFVVVVVVMFAGCEKDNPASCELPANAGQNGCPDAATSGGACKVDNDCTDKVNFPACEIAGGGGTCFRCTATSHALCTDQTPHCDSHECVACVDDNDCDSGAGVCLPSGGCAATSSIIHAKSNGTGMTCSASSPCSLDAALTAAKSGPKVVKLDDAGPYQSATNYTVDVDAGMSVTIDARNATIHRSGSGPIFTINDDKGMTLLGGTIEGPTGGTTEAIRCSNRSIFAAYGTTIRMSDGPGINAPGGCILTLSRSRIVSNLGGGVVVTNGKFVIVGNVFSANGDPNSPNGGVTISTGLDPTNRFEFNSISGNHAQGGGNGPGVQCTAGAGFIVRNNIIWDNNDNVGPQVGGNCKHAYSDIGSMSVSSTIDGGSNMNIDPMFTSDFHVMAISMVLLKADLSTKLDGIAARDIDGDRRVAPADLGADQLKRP